MGEGPADDNLAAKVSMLVARGDLDLGDPAYGVALAAVDLGYDRLTRAQRALFDRVVAPALAAAAAGRPPEAARRPRPKEAPAPVQQKASGSRWRPIRDAPEDQDVQVATMVDGAPSALAFPCRKANRTWVNSATGKPIFVRPTRWREWE